MKVLLFLHSLDAGGAERVTAHLVNHWSTQGWEITVVTIADRGTDFYPLHPAVRRVALGLQADSDGLAWGIWNNLQRIWKLRRTLQDARPAVALSMMNTSNVLLALACWGLPQVVAVGSERSHPPHIPLPRIWKLLRALLYSRLAAIVVLSEKTGSWLRHHTTARCTPVILNPVSWPLPCLPPIVDVPLAGPCSRMLLGVGRLSHEKGFDLLIEVFARIADDFPGWSLCILGEGPDRKALEALVETKLLGGRVMLPGRAGNIAHWYEAADLFVLTSRVEGFPNALAEALAHGVPAISFDCETGPDVILRHDIDGMLLPAGDDDALERALRRAMADDALRRTWSAAAKDARQRFALDHIALEWRRLFSALATRRGRSGA